MAWQRDVSLARLRRVSKVIDDLILIGGIGSITPPKFNIDTQYDGLDEMHLLPNMPSFWAFICYISGGQGSGFSQGCFNAPLVRRMWDVSQGVLDSGCLGYFWGLEL